MISAILLAAGESSRMKGENKLIKEINGTPLINYAVKNILGSAIDELIIVLGHEKSLIKNIIKENKKIKFIYNKDYKLGVASSIKKGVSNITKSTEAFFICLGDMPNINQNIYNKLIKTRRNYNKKLSPEKRKEIIIPTYEKKDGNPVLFSKFMKEKVMNINGDFGAKKIVEMNKDKILYVPIKNSGVTLDFDTKADFISS
ncbi:nucleotidyltransferase family protein [Pelagibacteraceae bacterium]|nr:nucleotidyltransferase family protein [Pelagibacteraceae bacterium]